MNSYLDCFLFFPLLLPILQIERSFITREASYQLPILDIVIIAMAFAIFFEEILPKLDLRFTRDTWDYLAYLTGVIFYFMFLRAKIKSR